MANESIWIGWLGPIQFTSTGSSITFPASILPAADNTYDLGSASLQWRSGYFGTSIVLADAAFIQFGTTTPPVLLREGASHLIDRNGTTAQRFSVANTYTSSINNELFSVDWQTVSNVALVGTQTAATGTARPLRLVAQGTNAANAYATIVMQGANLGFPTIRAGLLTSTLTLNTLAGTGNFIQLGEYTNTSTSGTVVNTAILPTYNQASGNAANTDLLINRTQTLVGSGAQLLIDAQVSTVSKFAVDNNGAHTKVGGITALGAVGVPTVVGVGRVTAQSAANASISTFTVGAADASFEISANMNVTVVTTLVTTLTCTYTDESNTARTMILPVTQLSGSFIAAGAITGLGAWETPVMHIRAKASTAITILTSAGTFTGVTYTAEGVIKQTK